MQISAVACSALVTKGTYYGLGRSVHLIDNLSDLSEVIKCTVIAPSLFLVSTTCGELSALIFLIRLMGMAAQRWHHVVLWTACGIMIILNVSGFIVTAGFCYPAAKQWDPSLDGWCMRPQVQYETRLPHFMSPLTTGNFVHRLKGVIFPGLPSAILSPLTMVSWTSLLQRILCSSYGD